MNNHVNPMLANVINIIASPHVPTEQLFRSDEQIIEDMNEHNRTVIKELRKEGQTIFTLRNHITLDTEA